MTPREDLVGRRVNLLRHLADIRSRHSKSKRHEAEKLLLEMLSNVETQIAEEGK